LTDDVNAVIEGLYDGGADSVFVVDAHGSFNPEPDIILDRMDSRAKMVFKDEKFHPYVDMLDFTNYDAIVAVGMHSRTEGGGFAEHTINLGTEWIINGTSLTESDIVALSWGRIGIPLIFVSGDDKLAEQLKWMNWLEYVTVKEAKAIDSVVLYPVDQVHEYMKQLASRAVQNLTNMKYIQMTGPITATLKVVPPADLTILANVPGLKYKDQSVTFIADDFMEMYEGMRGLMSVAQSGYYNIAAELYLTSEEDAFQNFKAKIFDTWIENASRNKPENVSNSAEENKTSNEKKLFFGSK